MTDCPKCHSNELVKNGRHLGRQRHRCKKCGFQFTRDKPRGRPACDKALAVTLYVMGLSFTAIAKVLKVSPPAVLRWVKVFAELTYEKPEPREAVVVELDEMWHYLHEKKENCGYGKLIVAIPVSSLTGNWAIVVKPR